MKNDLFQNQKLDEIIMELQQTPEHEFDSEAEVYLKDDLLQIRELISEINLSAPEEFSLKKQNSIYQNLK